MNDATREGHILVTGGAGFIGSHLVERLLADGNDVVVIDDLSTGSKENLHRVAHHPGIKILISRISDSNQLTEVVRGAKSIYHLAAAVGVELVVRSPVRVIETNLHETEALLDTATKFGTQVLLTSTSEVYGKSLKPHFNEDDDLVIGPPHQGRWSYACSKLMDEFLALAFAKEKGLPVVIPRLFNTVGPRQTGRYGMVLPRFIQSALRGEPLRVFGDGMQTRCFCLVRDTVEALVRLQNCNQARNQVINVGGTEEVSILDLARRVIELLKSQSQVEVVPYEQAYEPGFEDMRRRKPNVDKLASITGFRPQTRLDEIIQSTAASFKP